MRLFILAVLTLSPLFSPSHSFAQDFEVEVAFENLSFSRPVDIQNAGDGTNRLFVVEQHTGRIYVFENDQDVSDAALFLEVEEINTGGEEGLLGLAFHPDYENNGHFFVYYSTSGPRRSVVSRFTVDPQNPDLADPSSELVIIEIGQPFGNHNGGQLAFGPMDGLLYIGLGDGGSGGDPQNHGENPQTLLGSILRISVDNATEQSPYSIPADNPFFGNTDEFQEEIYAYGLRNPWRFSIDPVTLNIWTGDVGQGDREEIDIIVKGGNYGWNVMEASLCFDPSSNCSQDGLILPVWEYGRNEGISVTGGHVYRGSRIPQLVGKYIYADYVSRKIWAITYEGENDVTNEHIATASFNIPAFGVSENQELFIAGFDGKLHRLVDPQATGTESPNMPHRLATLGNSYPNPTYGEVTIPFNLQEAAQIEIAIYDLLGRKVDVVTDGYFQAGEHNITWEYTGNGERTELLPAGAYFYSLRLGDTVAATRMLTLVR